MPTSFVLGPYPAGKLDLLSVGCPETGRGGDALKCSILREYRHFCCAKTSYTEPGTTDSCCQQSLPEPGLLYAVHACWTFCMLAGLCACWLDSVHAGWTLCMLAGLCACWLDFVHAGCTSACSQDLLHAGRTNCTMAGLRACWLYFLHTPGSRSKFQVTLYSFLPFLLCLMCYISLFIGTLK